MSSIPRVTDQVEAVNETAGRRASKQTGHKQKTDPPFASRLWSGASSGWAGVLGTGLPPRTPKRKTSVASTLGWIAAFIALQALLSLPQLTPTVPHTALRLVSLPVALLALFLVVRPAREAPIYALIYVAVSLWWEFSSPHLGFSEVRIAIQAAQMLLLVWLLYRFFFPRFDEPLVVGGWAITVLLVTAGAASLTTVAAEAMGVAADDTIRFFGGSLGAAWRYWWLGNACSFLCIAGPIASLVNLRHRLALLLRTPGKDRSRFIALTASLTLTTLFAFPVFDMSSRGFPPDVMLALKVIPVPFAMAMAGRFRANGAALAILIFTSVAVYSVSGPAANANWAHLPTQATPTHALLLVTTIACMVLAGISRQLRRALQEAVEAGEVKSRIIGVMSHELRTPLNAILGFSELMKMQSLRELNAGVPTIDNIHASGQRLLAMIDALLNHAHEGGTIFELHKEPLHLASAVDGAVSEVDERRRRCRSTIEISVPDDLFLEADPRALRQILDALINDALRLCKAGDVIEISARNKGTDTLLDIFSPRLPSHSVGALDKVEAQLVTELVLAHGARLHVHAIGERRRARLRFFATRAAH